MLEARATGEASGHIASDQECQKERQEQPHEACETALGAALHAQSAQDPADDPTDDAAKDESGPQGRKPAEDDAGPARLLVPVRQLIRHALTAAPLLVPVSVAGTNLVLLHPRGVGVAFSACSLAHLSSPFREPSTTFVSLTFGSVLCHRLLVKERSRLGGWGQRCCCRKLRRS